MLRFISIYFLGLFGLISCSDKKEPVYQVCNCIGNREFRYEKTTGIVINTKLGYKILSLTNSTPISEKLCCSTFINVCNELPLEFQQDGLLVILSGRSIPGCKGFEGYYTIYMDTVKVDTIQKIDTIYENGPLTIKIIKTEDFGLPVGYGYEINYPEKKFFLRQTKIPALATVTQFKTRAAALKVAHLVAARLIRSGNFPTVYGNELIFMRVVDQCCG
jgi:hypothetical protein